jgi:hypothetical protein
VRALALLVVLAPTAAHADPAVDRPWHGSAGVGGTLLVTGGDGDIGRAEVEVDIEPRSRFGALVAWRGFDRSHRGLVAAGLVYEGGASRPRLVLDLHADIGADLDLRAPMLGGGARTVVTIVGPLGVAVDTGLYLVIDGIARTRLQLATGLAIVARW